MLPRKQIGVYRILNTTTGAVYVGSSARDIVERIGKHRRMLRNGKHSNAHLQHAWDRYGAGAFTFEIVEYTSNKPHTLAREQYWLDHYRKSGNCYNFLPIAGSGKGWHQSREMADAVAKTWAGFRAPDGTEYRNIHNLARFCREHRLSKTMMERLGRKEVTRTDTGWTHIDDDRDHGYKFMSPDGLVHRDIFDLKRFCRERGLDYRSMRYVAKGDRASHHGWTKADTDRSHFLNGKKRPVGRRGIRCAFVAPDGTLYDNITNLKIFAEQHGLDNRNLHAVHTGKVKSHKGWRKACQC